MMLISSSVVPRNALRAALMMGCAHGVTVCVPSGYYTVCRTGHRARHDGSCRILANDNRIARTLPPAPLSSTSTPSATRYTHIDFSRRSGVLASPSPSATASVSASGVNNSEIEALAKQMGPGCSLGGSNGGATRSALGKLVMAGVTPDVVRDRIGREWVRKVMTYTRFTFKRQELNALQNCGIRLGVIVNTGHGFQFGFGAGYYTV